MPHNKQNDRLYFIPVFSAVLLFALTIGVYVQLESQRYNQIMSVLEEDGQQAKRIIESNVNNSIIALRRMGERWEVRGGTPKQEWMQDAQHYVRDNKALTTVEWVDEAYHVRWVEPLLGNEKALGLNIAFDEERKNALQGAAQSKVITVTPPLDLVQGYSAFISYIPLHINKEFSGFIVGIYDIETFLESALPTKFKDNFNIQIMDGEKTVYLPALNEENKASQWIAKEGITLFNREWLLTIWPKKAFFQQEDSYLSKIILLAGGLLSLLLGFTIYYALMSYRRSYLLLEKAKALSVNQRELTNLTEKMQLILDSAGEGIFGLNLQGHSTFANKAAMEMLGYELDEMINTSQHDLIHHHYADGTLYPKEKCNIYASFKSGETRKVDSEVFWHKDGHSVPVEYTSTPIKDTDGTITGAVVVFRDITERQNHIETQILYTKKLEQATEEAQRANVMKSEFLANMSHEIRTPLNGVIGASDLLRKTKTSKDQEKYLQIIAGSGDILLSLINDVLDISKIEAGELKLYFEPVTLRQLIKDALHSIRPRAAIKDIKMDVVYEGAVPVSIMGDQVRLNQVLINLLGNAVKFVEEGFITVKVEEKKTADQDVTLRFSVEDSGIGIAPDKLDTIFQKFAQADATTTKKYGGTGLGLAITQRLVDLMDGEIMVESELGVGSTFWFEITCPIVEPASTEKDAPLLSADVLVDKTKQDAATDKTLSASILLVENEMVNQMVATDMLEGIGCSVDLAENGQEALDMLSENGDKYDVILMDCMMPVMDGFEATAAIRKAEENKEYRRQTIIAMTANAMADEKDKCLKVGMDDYLSKPVKEKTLYSMLKKWQEI
jgi:PAS domain S-box-containing protein